MEYNLWEIIIQDINNFLGLNGVRPTVIIGSESAKLINSNIKKEYIFNMKIQGYCIQMYGYKVSIGDFEYGYYLIKENNE